MRTLCEASSQFGVNQLVGNLYSPLAVEFVGYLVKRAVENLLGVVGFAPTAQVLLRVTLPTAALYERMEVATLDYNNPRLLATLLALCEVVCFAPLFFCPLVFILDMVYKASESSCEFRGRLAG